MSPMSDELLDILDCDELYHIKLPSSQALYRPPTKLQLPERNVIQPDDNPLIASSVSVGKTIIRSETDKLEEAIGKYRPFGYRLAQEMISVIRPALDIFSPEPSTLAESVSIRAS